MPDTFLDTAQQKKDPLWLNLSELPYFRGILRAIEAREYQNIELQEPIFDLGCGDGHFVSTAFQKPIDVGLDPWKNPIKEAAKRGSYRLAIYGDGHYLPFAAQSFPSAMSNSVLEHIPELEPVLLEVARILKPDGRFVFCVPNHRFLRNMSVSNFFDRIHLKFLGNAYRSFFNRISRHYHCDDAETWQNRLARCGFTVEKQWDYFSPAATKVLEWGHYFGLPSLILHFFTRKWILFATHWNLDWLVNMLKKYYNEDRDQPEGSYSFYIVRKTQ